MCSYFEGVVKNATPLFFQDVLKTVETAFYMTYFCNGFANSDGAPCYEEVS